MLYLMYEYDMVKNLYLYEYDIVTSNESIHYHKQTTATTASHPHHPFVCIRMYPFCDNATEPSLHRKMDRQPTPSYAIRNSV